MEWAALDYDFDWYVIEFEYCQNPTSENPTKDDKNYIKYSELLMKAKEYGAGYRVEWEDVLYIAPTPLVLIDDRNRFHSTTAPAIRWKEGKEFYFLSGVSFEKDLWEKVTGDTMSAKEVFAIKNMEQRRVAYEMMDKRKMLDLGATTLDEVKDDGYGNPMKVISFNVEGFNKPFIYLNCFCPSTNREYYLQTNETTCAKAKAKSFGLEEITFNKEW